MELRKLLLLPLDDLLVVAREFICPDLSRSALDRCYAATAFAIRTVLTNNGKEFTDRFCIPGERQPTGQHTFDRTYARHCRIN